MDYDYRSFKSAPKWKDGKIMLPTINSVLDATDGHTVHLTTMRAALKSWAANPS